MPESPVPRRLPPLNALVAFEAAARAGGVGRAAEALRVAQPAVSRHIRNLEGWLGAELFRREANRVRLTETGAALAVEVGAALDRIETAAARAREPAPREVRLGCSTGMAYQWAMPRLPDLRRALPEIGVALVVADDYAEFDARGVDLSLRFGDGRWPGRRADLLIPESDAPVAAPALIARRPELEPPVDPRRLDPRFCCTTAASTAAGGTGPAGSRPPVILRRISARRRRSAASATIPCWWRWPSRAKVWRSARSAC
jgi:LysR family glycine cleavage system transcriptional activator